MSAFDRLVAAGRELPDLNGVDQGALPARYKRYPRQGVRLPYPPRRTRNELGRLGDLLFSVNGLSRLLWLTDADLTLHHGTPSSAASAIAVVEAARPIPSAGARYPVELYVCSGTEVPGLPPGIYHYDPPRHALDVVRSGESRAEVNRALGAGDGPVPELIVLLTTVFWRTAAKYGAFAHRLLGLDAGVAAEQTLQAAACHGLPATLHTTWSFERADRILGLDTFAESTVAAVTCGRSVPPSTAPLSRPATAVSPETSIIGLDHLADLAEVHAASMRATPPPPEPRVREPWGPGRQPDTLTEHPLPRTEQPLYAAPSLDVALLTRRSTLSGYSPTAIIPAGLARILRSFQPGSSVRHLVLVHRVTGLPTGSYHYDATNHTLLRIGLRPDVLPAVPPLLRKEYGEAAAVLVPVGDYAGGGELGHRLLTLETGRQLQRAALAATSAGLACRVHCDFPGPALLARMGVDGSGLDALALMTLGVPPRRSVPADLCFSPALQRTAPYPGPPSFSGVAW
ncbi:SagB family peptide dehydrogenase [Nonomuraea jiangxiensis]|uniref:SagB-type dehydrogenase domain-containing protein n=1 Tax=Nonomuraea jiangxiensis TaxID=633440 RepID=A0A1G8S1C4_9ACTN|nr:SagB family peptide dehydrogenase [Nonomuraea jiangxiensis]SDJ22595.1 SagB-type dehydrogenase domain-containing protein [Nonomuraea jiangxiensis]